MKTFKAMVVRKADEDVNHQIEEITENELSQGEVTIEVAYSSLNYKDMLAFQKDGNILSHYPMIPGIDLSGTVINSTDSNIKQGQQVIVTSFDLGMSHTGGLSEVARVPSEWVVPLPEGLSLKDAMIYGTAGFTAAQSIDALEKNGMTPENQPNILVTGASGGVGSIALAILAKRGYSNLHALVRKDYQVELVKSLGAEHILWPDDLGEKKALGPRRFDYVVDTVGGDVAATIIPQINHYGSMSMCGNAAGVKLATTVFPLILRGVNLLGINSQLVPLPERTELWQKLASEWNVVDELHSQTIPLDKVNDSVNALKEGKHTGRTLVEIKAN